MVQRVGLLVMLVGDILKILGKKEERIGEPDGRRRFQFRAARGGRKKKR